MSAVAASSDSDLGTGVRVVIAEDAYLVREGLESVLSKTDGIELVRACEDRDSLLSAVAEDAPDVVLTDIRMPPTRTDEGIQIARELRETNPQLGIVVLSEFVEASYVLDLLEHGSAGRAYLLKERVGNPTQLTAAIRAVVSGESVIDPAVVELLVQARKRGAQSPLGELTAREHEVLAEIAHGKSNAAIAESLVLTKRAVEKHINSIFGKLGLPEDQDVSRRVKATLMYLADRG